jgi:TIR domain-containing protein
MIFSLEVLPAGNGDCLLAHWGPKQSQGLMMIDSGPRGFYRSTLLPRLAQIHEDRILAQMRPLSIDLALLTHVDRDRIRGLVDLTDAQLQSPRPLFGIRIEELWYNGLDSLPRNDERIIEGFASSVDSSLESSTQGLIEGLGESRVLSSNAQHLSISVNPHFDGGGVTSAAPPIRLAHGLTMRVIAPAASARRNLIAQLSRVNSSDSFTELAPKIGDATSIAALAEFNGKTMLLTGLARLSLIMQQLRLTGLLSREGKLHVDILEVPARGVLYNTSRSFYEHITADHYVFTGNGIPGPDPETVRDVLEVRRGHPIGLHFAHDIGEINRTLNRFVKYLPGQSLADILRRKALSEANASLTTGAQLIELMDPSGLSAPELNLRPPTSRRAPRTARIGRAVVGPPVNEEINEIVIPGARLQRRISFWQGNPADINPDNPVDLLIVSAFRNDYTPTRWSIIGALYRKGVSVAALALNKEIDLRETAGFWLSRPLVQQRPLSAQTTPIGAKRILCFEPQFLGTQPAEVVGHLFRGLFPFLSDRDEASVAMAVISTGALGEQPERMLRALVNAAREWMSRGLPIRELMIMEQNPSRVKKLAPVFEELKRSPIRQDEVARRDNYDLFLSFSSEDAHLVDVLRDAFGRSNPELRLFDYRVAIDPGRAWQDELDAAIENCRNAMALLSPSYFRSAECKEEIGIARLRHKRSSYTFLVPLYVRSLENEEELPLWLQAINYVDCRESDPAKLSAAVERFLKMAPR